MHTEQFEANLREVSGAREAEEIEALERETVDYIDETVDEQMYHLLLVRARDAAADQLSRCRGLFSKVSELRARHTKAKPKVPL